MNIEEKKSQTTIMQNLILENKEKLTITGTRDVLSFDDKIIILDTTLRYVNNQR